MNAQARHGDRGFTFVEVISCVLVITVGLMGAVALIVLGISKSVGTQAAATAMATATSAAVDETLLTAQGGGLYEGYLNGYFVRRQESDGGTTVAGAPTVGFVTRVVTVEVYDTDVSSAIAGVRKKHILAAHTQRLIRHQPIP